VTGQRLRILTSGNGRFTFTYQDDGNLVLYSDGGTALWSAGTSGAGQAVLQGDGNFVVYDHSGQPVWNTGTAGRGDRLIVQDDGNVVLYDAAGSAVWNTGTAGAAGGGSGGGTGGGDGGDGGDGGGADACASPETHDHAGACGGADSCGHVFGSDTDCGCAHAPIVHDTCYQTVCDTDMAWVEDTCEGTTQVCDTETSCWATDDGVTECADYAVNCRDESYSYVCGGHWVEQQANCRDEAYACNPHQCEG
jgi:hypothetical protein